ncbi:MAG: hypothetical protein PHP59_06255 [Methanofollis sp.]|uniref:hypothetical protein n=1 Tax=Methanofollis sp. TaxID=2052835 RepID=UPI0026171108|nr:hypothetical protein [Methanofollis sp.]MDD4254965.1 hypothetical protein [Methanofollis sp.]
MKIMDVINEILGQSRYLGSFPYCEMAQRAGSEEGAIGVFVDGLRNSVVLFSCGEPSGAIYGDEVGALYGDPAALKILEMGEYELYATEKRIVDMIVARCRVFNRSHFPHQLTSDIPEFGGERKSPGILSIVVEKENSPQSGMRVSIRKGRHVLLTDTTTGDGRASFRLLNGRYDVIVVDRAQEVYTFMVDFHGSRSELVIELGGMMDG